MDPSSSAKRQTDSNSDDELEQPNCKRPKNDVFINYSYEDIGKQFISHLKGALSRNSFGISDHTMLAVGQDMRLHLLKAIEESEIYRIWTAVRSLDELVDIMDCLGKLDQRKVLPVFYKVEPSDVRSQDGSFKDAFQAHEANDNIDPKRVQKWKQALRDAGQLSGLTLQNGDEGKFVAKIIKQLEMMQSPQELHIADHPVEIGSRAEKLISTLRLDCEDVLVVAVFGCSGIGKTTIVRATHNKIYSYFDVSYFLGDIRYRCAGPNWKIELQNQLISRLTQNNKFPSMHHHNDGVTKIRNLIRGRKILLVLDDVDNFEQLKSLGITPAWFYKGSRIIVITRDKQSLGIIPYTSYQITELNRWESLNLFNRLMFSRDNNLINMKFIKEVAALSGGLPLVLEVWSRYFIGHERKQWPSLLEKLKRIPHGDVQKQLQMSYDSLSVTAKNLFLDIACFFNGMDKELVVKVLHDEESTFFPDIEIQHLVDKFLVKDIGCNRFLFVAMNQVIGEMGQEVIRQENVDEPGKRTRLTNHRDILRVFRDCSGTDIVRSIHLEAFNSSQIEEPVTVQLEAFKKMSNLRFIQLYDREEKLLQQQQRYLIPQKQGMGSEGKLQWSFSSKDDTDTGTWCFSFKHLKYLVWKRNKVPCKSMSCFSFKQLKYLGWEGFPCKCLDNIDMGNVVVIILKYSKLEKLWDGVKNFKKLKILDVSWSESLTKTGNFIGLENLEKLVLEGCENLEELDSSISCLHQLTSLTLSKCTNLKSIPDLPLNIEYFEANDCINLVNLPSNFSELQFLTKLELHNCSKLGSKCFTQVTELRNLHELGMANCNVSQVSSGIGNLVSLRVLYLPDNTFSSLPDSFSNLSKLKTLYVDGCSELQLLPPLPSQLTNIIASDCWSLDVMPFDSKQNAYIFSSKELLTSTKGLDIRLSGKELPEWCTYRNSGNNVLSFEAPIQVDHSKICGLILCATRDNKDDEYDEWANPTIYNRMKGTSHQFHDCRYNSDSMMVMFYPLNDTTLVVEAGDTVELQFFDDEHGVKRCGLRLIYEDDVVDSGLVFKDVRKPTISLFPLSSESKIMTSNSITEINDEGVSYLEASLVVPFCQLEASLVDRHYTSVKVLLPNMCITDSHWNMVTR
ncbi:TMV resistance protein N [Artemisia annua]|uniref:ADP-ribosyl cyclase/cyclic ADP-ribose hydrolase n=1 Tax=Artemisia annua TaxID=35608 RepID=A0A2U1NMQ7_ARTAN|nr:TMV resistance protein N [Artemisia annua]